MIKKLAHALNWRMEWTVNRVNDQITSQGAVLDTRLDEMARAIEERSVERQRAVHEGLEVALVALHELQRAHSVQPGRIVPQLSERSFDAISDDIAEFLNWTNAPDGWASQAELWFNSPVLVAYLP